MGQRASASTRTARGAVPTSIQHCREAVPTLTRHGEVWLEVGLHTDFDLGLLGQAFVAVSHDLIDVPRGFVEEAGDIPRDGFVLVRE
jgi:hypothetical protein